MDIPSKFSLYDILAMIIPGGVVIAGILVGNCVLPASMAKTTNFCCGCQIIEFDPDLYECGALIIISYLLGLINNWISDGIFRGFRNYGYAIKSALIDILETNENNNLKTLDGITAYEHTKGANSCPILIIIKTLCKIVASIIPCRKAEKNSHILKLYFNVYYKLWRNNLLGAVPLIEGQVSLLRNLIIPIMIFAYFTENKIGLWRILLIILLILIVMIQRQQKIYKIVWEIYNYCKI